MLIGMTYPAQRELQVDTLMGVDHGGQSSPAQHDNIALTEGLPVHSLIVLAQYSSISYAPFWASSQEEPSGNDIVDAVRVCHTKRRSVHKTDLIQRKRYRICDARPNLDVPEAYLTGESSRCECVGHQPPHETFLTPAIQETFRDPSAEKTKIPAKILKYIASTCLINASQSFFGDLQIWGQLRASQRCHHDLEEGNLIFNR
jgi:hypothetical protein